MKYKLCTYSDGSVKRVVEREPSDARPERPTKVSELELTKEQYDGLKNGTLKYEGGKVVPVPERPTRELTEEQREQRRIRQQIAHLKSELAKTDYQAIKHSEGWISDEDYAEIKASRQELRNQINVLEAQLD